MEWSLSINIYIYIYTENIDSGLPYHNKVKNKKIVIMYLKCSWTYSINKHTYICCAKQNIIGICCAKQEYNWDL